mmetsp:Transcript_23130/g.31674  ORF Transcript_23130/g.31674 Transcript_23130/m.31674 type:complete len:148 (-) Transcript_23130:7-450(-)
MKFLQLQQSELQIKEISRQELWNRIGSEIESICVERENFLDQPIQLGYTQEVMLSEHRETYSNNSNKISGNDDDNTPNIPLIQTIDKDAVIATSKACEILVLDLTLKAWQNMNSGSTRLTKKDLMAAIASTEAYDMFTIPSRPSLSD